MDLTGTITKINMNYQNKKPIVELELDTNDFTPIEELSKLEKLTVVIKKWFKKRSLDANSYLWVLADKIAKKLSDEGSIVTKEDVYIDAIKQIGVFESLIIPEKAFDHFKFIWEKQGLGYVIEEERRKDKCIRIKCYYGSSSYNTKEMSYVINLLVELAKNYGIETKTEQEINSLLNSWR